MSEGEHVSEGPDCFPDGACSRCWEKRLDAAVQAERDHLLVQFEALAKELDPRPRTFLGGMTVVADESVRRNFPYILAAGIDPHADLATKLYKLCHDMRRET